MEPAVASSPSSSILPAGEYEVFLSFRGAEVRNTFADHLYTSLARSKIRTFRDEEELRKGEGIAPSLVRAIPESKIYIPILTQQYASSRWCLEELAQMVECWKRDKKKGHLILPIFYFVEPRDVRHVQGGPYQQAFEQHAQSHSPQTVMEWEGALQEVGEMKGWHVTESKGQGAVIDEVLSKVELHLRSMYTLVTDELVGIDTRVEEVIKLLNLGSSEGTVIVGIHGMSGIGKTTLSKAVYNEVCTQFDRCCFLEDVRENLTKSDGVVALQNKVISSVLKDDYQVKNVSEGINMIKERVCKHKLLLVIDDVDDNFEFNKTLGKLGDFSVDSRLIFTTRNKGALDLLPRCKLYEPGEMNHHHAIKLFSKHAFGMDHPPEGYETIAREFVKVAAGLPLALEVIGSLLFRKEMNFWEEKLMELQEIPSSTENKVQKRLKISYSELSHTEKQIFLDIACFFIGADKELPCYMWSSCNFHPVSGVNTLMLRSLIKVDEENRFWMHDHLRDLGRAIIKEEDIQHPYKRSRIWSTEDALNMLRNEEGNEHVEVLRLDVNDRDYHERLLTSNKFKKLSGLRYLEVQYGYMTGDFSQILPNMCCLRLHHCGSIPININTNKLAVLDLERCHVKDDWKGWNGIKEAGKLKAVNLPDCSGLTRAPDLYTCTGLEFINFERCGNMEGGLHIGNFKNLKTLRLRWTKITELIISMGGEIGKLQRLEEMDLRLTELIVLPAGMENLSSLKILLLESRGYQMEEIPKLPVSLKRLTISSPSGVPNLLELQELESLSYLRAHSPRIPGDLWRLPNLKELTLMHCCLHGPLLQRKVTSPAAALPPSLTSLHIQDSRPLNELPSLANLRNLTQLKLTDIRTAQIRGLGELRVLESMVISNAMYQENLDGLENLVLLTTLSVKWCSVLERLPSVSNLIKLKQLEVCHCPVLVEILGLGDLGESLSRLEIKGCPRLANWDGLGLLGALEDLTLEKQSFGAKPYPDLSGLVNLKRLNIIQCPKLTQVRGLEKLVKLESLNVTGCTSIRDLPDLSALRNLKRLVIAHCASLINLTGIDRLESLWWLQMYNCCSVTKLPNLSGLKNLEMLNLSKCRALAEVKGIDGLESLTMLQMYDCRSIRKLPNLSGLKNLEVLDLTHCTMVAEAKGVEGLESLTTLRMSGCRLMELGNLSGVKNLEELNIEGCTKLTEVNGGMGKRMAKSAARFGKKLASSFVALSPTACGSGTTTST